MTSGYKSQSQLEYEREKKRQEDSIRPVPTEWKVEQLEKNMNANHDQYMQYLEKIRQQELQSKYVKNNDKPAQRSIPNDANQTVFLKFSEPTTLNKN